MHRGSEEPRQLNHGTHRCQPLWLEKQITHTQQKFPKGWLNKTRGPCCCIYWNAAHKKGASCSLPQLMWMHAALPSPPSPQPTSFLLSSTPWIMKPSKYTVELRVPQAGDRDVMNRLRLCPDLQTVCQKAWVTSGVMWRGSNARNLTVHCPPGVYHCGEVDRWRGASHENSCSAAEEPLQQLPHKQESNVAN